MFTNWIASKASKALAVLLVLSLLLSITTFAAPIDPLSPSSQPRSIPLSNSSSHWLSQEQYEALHGPPWCGNTPVHEDDLPEPFLDLPRNCHIVEGVLDSRGNPVYNCDYVAGDYDEWVAGLGDPFRSDGDCWLSKECHSSVGFDVDPDCSCECDGEWVDLGDARCGGFAGELAKPEV